MDSELPLSSTSEFPRKRKSNPDRDPHIHGHMPGVPVGSTFPSRLALWKAGVHGMSQAGIHGSSGPAYSIVMSGRYADDCDEGESFVYCGEGGTSKQKNGKDTFLGDQCADQTWGRGNKSLQLSHESGLPVRVVRGHKLNSRYAPVEGFRYDGLYQVTQVTYGGGKTAFKTCQFTFNRLPDQPSLPNEVLRPRKPTKPHSESSASTPGAGSSRDGAKSRELGDFKTPPLPLEQVFLKRKRKEEDNDDYTILRAPHTKGYLTPMSLPPANEPLLPVQPTQPVSSIRPCTAMSPMQQLSSQSPLPNDVLRPPKSTKPRSESSPSTSKAGSSRDVAKSREGGDFKTPPLPLKLVSVKREPDDNLKFPEAAPRTVVSCTEGSSAPMPVPPSNEPLPPPEWLSKAITAIRAVYKNDKYELYKTEYSWRIRCLDCPGKGFLTGKGETLNSFQAHLNTPLHRQHVDVRVMRQSFSSPMPSHGQSRENQAHNIGLGPAADLEKRMVIDWLKNTSNPTTRDYIQYFRPYLTNEANRSKFIALIKEVAELKEGVVVLRDAYRGT